MWAPSRTGVADSVGLLTSDHEPTTAHRDAALAALRAVASDLSPSGRTGGAVA